ncbi:MAG: L,D-transpeptidase family protein [Fimbriimonadaceae bacterium]|nr:L,D-transpeptidase family protein [Fimbriimonadaceae bacterium]
MIGLFYTLAVLSHSPLGVDPPMGAVVADAITYRIQPGVVWVPLRVTMESAGILVDYDSASATVILGRTPVPKEAMIEIRDETFVNLEAIQEIAINEGFTVASDGVRQWRIENGSLVSYLRAAPHRVEISLDEQRLRGWQGDRLVIETNVSTGAAGYRTPMGQFTSGPEYNRYRVSRKYDNAPMPYSVQVEGGVFIHGSGSVPRYPASHGCIRMPLTRDNPAKRFFEWIEPDSPITIAREFLTPPPMVIPDISAENGDLLATSR